MKIPSSLMQAKCIFIPNLIKKEQFLWHDNGLSKQRKPREIKTMKNFIRYTLLLFPIFFFAQTPKTVTPVIPDQGAVASGNYRNILVEAGYSQAEVTAKIDKAWNQLFYGDSKNQRLYYTTRNGAYIKDVNPQNNDVRSEGMSYGMMIAVQLNKKKEFDLLWQWAKTYMQHQSGPRKNYFAWQCNDKGKKLDKNSASDGEIYFATSLYFAAARWGTGPGIFNYRAEADAILEAMLSKDSGTDGITNMFNKENKQVVFVPYKEAADYTDPSYHLPAFFEIWGKVAAKNNDFWKEAANVSRDFFIKTANKSTGLMPDYAEFNGKPKAINGHDDFRFDAFRCIMNMAMDYAWFKGSENEKKLVEKQHKFFQKQGINSYVGLYTIKGKPIGNFRATGLIATNAVGALATDKPIAWKFVNQFMNTSIPSGQYRYYDGMLYMLSLLHLAGEFKAYIPE